MDNQAKEKLQRNTLLGYWIFSALAVVLGLIGLVLAAKAMDNAIMSFGLGLIGFAVVFVFFAINRTHSLKAE